MRSMSRSDSPLKPRASFAVSALVRSVAELPLCETPQEIRLNGQRADRGKSVRVAFHTAYTTPYKVVSNLTYKLGGTIDTHL